MRTLELSFADSIGSKVCGVLDTLFTLIFFSTDLMSLINPIICKSANQHAACIG